MYTTLSFKKEFEVKEIIVKDGTLFITPQSAKKAEQTVSEILTLSKNANSKFVKLDLCNLNMFDALKVATLTATYGLTQNLSNKYEVIVADKITEQNIKLLSLSNLNVHVKSISEKEMPKIAKLLSVKV